MTTEMTAYHKGTKRFRRNPDEDFKLGFVRTCSCGHAPGLHALAKLGQPTPCEEPGCPCRDLDAPKPPERAVIHDFEGPTPKLGTVGKAAGARRIA